MNRNLPVKGLGEGSFSDLCGTGAVSGHCGPLGVSGMLWFTWSNDSPLAGAPLGGQTPEVSGNDSQDKSTQKPENSHFSREKSPIF